MIMHEPPFLVEPFSPPLGDARCITVANSEIRVRCGQSQSTPDVMIDATHSLVWFEPRRAAPTKVQHPRRMRLNEVELHCCATASAWFTVVMRWAFPNTPSALHSSGRQAVMLAQL